MSAQRAPFGPSPDGAVPRPAAPDNVRRGSLWKHIACRLRAAATYDFFPRFSAKVRRLLYNPLSVLILASLAALCCGLFLHRQGLVLCGGVWAVLLLGLLWPWVTLRGLRASIAFERRQVSEGDRVEVILTLRNRLPWSAWGLAVRGGFGDPAHETGKDLPVVTIARAPGRRLVRCRWLFVPTSRGVYPRCVPRLTTGFPFGLWENQRTVAVETPLVVWPQTFPVGPMPPISGDQQVEGNVSRNKVGSSGDVLGVRPYRRGDAPRRIHWGQSARHDRLIVCELQTNSRPVVQFVVDTDSHAHTGRGRDSSREWAIRIAASLARGWLETGAQVGAVWHGQVIPAASGRTQLHRLLDSLALLPDTPGPSLAETLANPPCRSFTDGLQVIVATDAAFDPRASCRDDDWRLWVVLRANAFAGSERDGAGSGARCRRPPWLWIDARERIPALLRSGWKEARHGS